MRLVVGLGNPGRSYARDRHNIGFRCLSYFAKLHDIRFADRHCQARIGTGEVGGSKLLLAKPWTFVNLSGKAVGCLARKHDIPLADILVVYDDLDLPVGKIRLRGGGGSGGHKGIKSIIAALGSEDFPRVRIGIGRPEVEEKSSGEDMIVNYVLGDFSPQEEQVIRWAAARVAEAIECVLSQGIEVAMSKFNRASSEKPE